MSTTITGSPNISSLDSKIEVNFCTGFFYVDVSPSVFLPGGTSTSGGVQGASVKITNPLGVVIKQYSTSGYDIYPPMTSRVSVAIPTVAGVYQFGVYVIDVRLTDDDGTEYTVSKNVHLCPPDPNNKNKNSGCLNVKINGNCKDGKVVILLDQPANYKSTLFSSQVIALIVQYPTSSGLPNLVTTYPAFSIPLFEGEYIVTGTSCVYYSYGDNVFYYVNYVINCSKDIKCIIDLCCVQAKWDELSARLDSDCTADEKSATMGIIIESQFYVNAAQGAAQCGADPSDWIEKLELLLGCVCTCNCNEGTPIIDNTPAKDFLIEGCNVVKNTVGLTDHYDINVFDYVLVNDDEGVNDILTLSAVSQSVCEKNQHINFDLAKLITLLPNNVGQAFIYRGLLTQTSTNNPTEVSVDDNNTVTAVWTRDAAGEYIGTLTGLSTPLTASNTFVICSSSVVQAKMSATYESANSIRVKSTAIDAGVPQDGLMINTPIEINILNIAM